MMHCKWFLMAGLLVACCSRIVSADEPAKAATESEKETGLVAYWKFDEGEGNTAKDSAEKHQHDGTITGAKWVDGKVGKALQFDGASGYVSVPSASDLDFTKAITIEAWIKHQGTDFKPWETILAKGDNAYRLHLNANGNPLDLGLNGYDDYWDLPSEVVPADDKWQFVVATFDGDKACVYVDGKQSTTSDQCPKEIHSNQLDLYIGNNVDKTDRTFKGIIDEVKLYNRALSADEIAKQYEKAK